MGDGGADDELPPPPPDKPAADEPELARLWQQNQDTFWMQVGQGYDPEKLQTVREHFSAASVTFLSVDGEKLGDEGARLLGAVLKALPTAVVTEFRAVGVPASFSSECVVVAMKVPFS